MTTATLVHTSTTPGPRRHIAAIARVLNAPVAHRPAPYRCIDGQVYDDLMGDYCLICGRATDHLGEHTPEQVDAWKATQAANEARWAARVD